MSATDQQVYKGKISFINHDKEFATIEYIHGNKEKAVNFKTDITGTGKKPHQFRLGDGVNFQLKLSDRGDKMAAYNVKFTHNSSIDLLIQKAALENRFSGYLKIVEGNYFVKEWESYILFPLRLSAWEVPPVESAANEAISFTLANLDKPNAIVAELFSHNFIPEYKKALQHFKNKIGFEATVSKVSQHAVYLNMFGESMRAKLTLQEWGDQPASEGKTIHVMITFLTPYRVVVRKIDDTSEPGD